MVPECSAGDMDVVARQMRELPRAHFRAVFSRRVAHGNSVPRELAGGGSRIAASRARLLHTPLRARGCDLHRLRALHHDRAAGVLE